jgi:hypothetical protein
MSNARNIYDVKSFVPIEAKKINVMCFDVITKFVTIRKNCFRHKVPQQLWSSSITFYFPP